MTPPKPSRRRLTQAEYEAVMNKARQPGPRPAALDKPLRTRTGRRRLWWQRGWKR